MALRLLGLRMFGLKPPRRSKPWPDENRERCGMLLPWLSSSTGPADSDALDSEGYQTLPWLPHVGIGY
jgi:hypothetical protein